MSELIQDELATLKARADLLGVQYHPSIGTDKLKEKIAAALSGKSSEEDAPVVTVSQAESAASAQQRLRDEQLSLVRIRLTCMNPTKAEWQGELFTVGNSLVGSLTKFVPFNADDGWHVPQILLDTLKDRQCQVFVTTKDSRGNSSRQGKLIKEFAVEVLPALTQSELHELARRQAMASTD